MYEIDQDMKAGHDDPYRKFTRPTDDRQNIFRISFQHTVD
jgi:hypothetical protein